MEGGRERTKKKRERGRRLNRPKAVAAEGRSRAPKAAAQGRGRGPRSEQNMRLHGVVPSRLSCAYHFAVIQKCGLTSVAPIF